MPSLSLAWKTYRSSLPWVLLRRLLGRFVRIETLVVYRHELRDFPASPSANDSVTHVMRIDDVSSEAFRRLCRKYPDKRFYERLRRKAQHCFVALRDNTIAGYAWATTDDLYIDEIACMYPVAPDEIFIYDCFVDAASRGLGVYPSMLEFIIRESHQRDGNLKSAGIAASALNRASIRGVLKAGFVEQKRIRYVECLQKQKWWGFNPAEA